MHQLFIKLSILFILPALSFATIRDYQTARMISTSGAGVASVLMIEGLTLNPASSGFFQDSMFYAQHNNGGLKNKNSARPADDQFSLNPKGFMVGVTDSDTRTPGGFSYQKYEENETERERFSINLAKLIKASTSFGISYHYTMDDFSDGTDKKSHRVDIGFLSLFGKKFSAGLNIKGVLANKTIESIFTLGSQYVLTQNITILLDLGYNHKSSFSNTFFYKGAAHIKLFKDFSVRFGVFDDKNSRLKGSSMGVSWFGPRLAVELAAKSSKPKDDLGAFLYPDEKISEFSAAFTIKI